MGLAALMALASCGPPPSSVESTMPASSNTASTSRFGPAPPVGEGPLAPEVQEILDRAWDSFPRPDPADLESLGRSGDARLAWLLSDYLRFNVVGDGVEAATGAFQGLTGFEIETVANWVDAVDHLMGWDLPAFPGYVDYKRVVFATADERWEPFFTSDSDIDYRWWTWGGVLIDDSPPGMPGTCRGCIPAVDDPQVTTADDGDWYPDERPVMGVVIGDEARAYPRNIMEVHEMMNDTLGDRSFALPYCTLCGSAQLYFTDRVADGDEMPVMRTSGLLSRSNKVMYDVVTGSVFDTFTGAAVSGPLRDDGVVLERGTVVTTSWGDWKAEYPHTTIVELEGGSGRSYPLEPLGDRDAAGPIFPVGEIDDRMGVHDQVLGVLLDGDRALAFPVEVAREALQDGRRVEMSGVEVHLDAGGLSATVGDEPVPSHQAFWFAWSQFHPDTLLWVG